jgi:hypothetical protein
MPDDNSGDPVQQQSVEQRPNAVPLNSASSPDDRHSPAAQGISRQEVQSEVKDIEDRVNRAERWMIYLTGAVAFFGLCSVIVGILQWRSMNGQLREMHEGGIDTHALADAASDQADAAQQFSDTAEDINGGVAGAVDQLSATADNARASIRAAQNSLHIDQRAWVGVSDITKPDFAVDKPFVTKVLVKNTGKTPAKDVTVTFAIRPGDPNNPDPSKLPAQPAGSHGVLLPNIETEMPLDATHSAAGGKLSQSVFDQINSGQITMLVYGTIEYEDVFGYRHWVKSCAYFNLRSKTFAQCKTYNDIDKESR